MTSTISITLLSFASFLLAWIDLRRGIIPNWLNLAIATAGLARAMLTGGVAAVFAAGAQGLAVGAIVWLLRRIYFMARKFEGLGFGDVKLLAASGIWIGMAGVPLQLLTASLSALAAAIFLRIAGKPMTRQTSLPFGPFLALGLLVTLALQQAGFSI